MRKLGVKKTNNLKGILLNGAVPKRIEYLVFEQNRLHFDDKSSSLGSCINCQDKPCYSYSAKEFKHVTLEGFPINTDTRICPSKAIQVSGESAPTISADCISCGLCVYRCPTGAIHLNLETNKAEINMGVTEHLNFVEQVGETEETIDVRRLFSELEQVINVKKVPKSLTTDLYNKLRKGNSKVSDQELVFVRNLLNSIGVRTQVSTKGNVDSRIDLIGQLEGKYLIGEVEIKGDNMLGLPRRILEDVAILESRFGISKKDQLPLLVYLNFPSKRSDIYEVIYDILNITGIKIVTLPTHFLLVCYFLKKTLSEKEISSCYIDHKNADFRKIATSIIPEIEEKDEQFQTSNLYRFIK